MGLCPAGINNFRIVVVTWKVESWFHLCRLSTNNCGQLAYQETKVLVMYALYVHVSCSIGTTICADMCSYPQLGIWIDDILIRYQSVSGQCVSGICVWP